jgi:hypothetical protein
MSEPAMRWRIPWGLVLTLALLAAGVGGAIRWLRPEPAPWDVIGSAVLTVGAAFLAIRWLQNYFWGVVTAALLVVHPQFWKWAEPYQLGMRGEALEMVTLALVIAGWRLAYRPDFAWREWLVLFGAGIPATCAAFRDGPGEILVPVVILVVMGCPLGTVLAGRRRLRGGENRPHRGNLACNLLVGVAWIIAVSWPSWFRGPGLDEGLLQWQSVAANQFSGAQLRNIESERLEQWAWPSLWVVTCLMVWGLWCTLRRGWRESKRLRPPTGWLLTLYAAATVLIARDQSFGGAVLMLTTLAILLSVFGVADLLRGISEQLVLLPPAERGEMERH